MQRIPFTKMHGAGNDFVVIDETRLTYNLSREAYRRMADRRFGVGADQILTVRPGREGADFEYVIHNADGGEVEQCGNGARCFARYVLDKGLTRKDCISVITKAGKIELRAGQNGLVTVNMGVPQFAPERIPFVPSPIATFENGFEQWPIDLQQAGKKVADALVSVVSMGNPHAVQLVNDVDAAPVLRDGPLIENHPQFPQRVNAGFMEVLHRAHIRLRVYERGAGETLACGTGACAAVVCGIRLGLLDETVLVDTRGGQLRISWPGVSGGLDQPVMMSGPAVTVFEGLYELPQ